MLIHAPQALAGHVLIEALVTSSILLVVAAGLWRIASTASQLAASAARYSHPLCTLPSCTSGAERIECTCGEQRFVILR